jgi:hypothetical protein
LGGKGHARDERRHLAGVGEAADQPGERLGADLLEALEALEADLGAGEERHREDDEHHPAADDQRARADGDVGDEGEEHAAVAPHEDLRRVGQDADVEAELAAHLLQAAADPGGETPDPAADGGGCARHQNFCGIRAK